MPVFAAVQEWPELQPREAPLQRARSAALRASPAA
jgi:hypothetical protein